MFKKLFKQCKNADTKCCNYTKSADNPVYAFGFIGSLIYFWQTTDPGFIEKIVAILKALFWPGFLVYELLKYLGL